MGRQRIADLRVWLGVEFLHDPRVQHEDGADQALAGDGPAECEPAQDGQGDSQVGWYGADAECA